MDKKKTLPEEEIDELPTLPPLNKKAKKSGIIVIIKDDSIILDVNGMGERIPFDKTKHAGLKVGDKIEF